jgi:biopolymer transport protein ExbD
MAKVKKHEIPEHTTINMTPLIDVVFQLLLFFMLASSLTRPNKIELNLPESSSGVKAAAAKSLAVTYMLEDGQVWIDLNGERMPDLETLGERMRTWEGEGRDEVSIQIQKDVPYQDVVSVIDTVRDAGYPAFSLLTLASSGRLRPQPGTP